MFFFDRTSFKTYFILLLLCFIAPTYQHGTKGRHRRFKTLWKPYTQFNPTQTRPKKQLSNKTTVYRRTTYVTIAVNYDSNNNKVPFWMNYDYRDQPSAGTTQKLPLVVDNVVTTEDMYRGVQYYKNTPTNSPTTLNSKWQRPSIWETPNPSKTIIWSWTTTSFTAKRTGANYPENFYQYLARSMLKRGGTTHYTRSLPTFSPIFGTTNIWRFWSYNIKTGNIDSFLALETEKQLRYRAATMRVKDYSNISCYVCGLDLPGLPMPDCHRAFEGPDNRHMHTRRSYRRRCVDNNIGASLNRSQRLWFGDLYRDGCFKRFTDVGIEFDERGCRTMEPVVGLSVASKRFARLERTLHDVDEGCVASPLASLTPFSRAISLYVRYHVCVCKGRYCNRVPSEHRGLTIVVLSWSLFVLRIQFILYH